MNPAQTPGAPVAGGSYPYEVTKSIQGSVGKTLLECIRQNVVETPPLMSWNDWQRWRKTTSPKEGTDGFRQEPAIERLLYLAVMEALYGKEWQTQLDRADDDRTSPETKSSGGNLPGKGLGVGTDQSASASDVAPVAAPRRGQAATPSIEGTGGKGGDILQSQDPWQEAAAASRSGTPTRESPAVSGPPGLAEPRRAFQTGEGSSTRGLTEYTQSQASPR